MVYLNPANQCAFLLIRTFHMGSPWLSLRGAHELCIHREGSALQLQRWSQTAQCPKPWASLYFQTWEGMSSLTLRVLSVTVLLPVWKFANMPGYQEMVLFHSTFVSLKARNALTVNVRVDEYKLAGERRLFQACVHSFRRFPQRSEIFEGARELANQRENRQIIDDDFRHSLIVYHDTQTKGIRLHAAVWDGELRRCPVWTAFGTSPPAWALGIVYLSMPV